MSIPSLRLKKDQERRLLAGHCWIYSNEVDTKVTPLKGLEPGQPVEFRAQHGRWLGHGYVNPNSLIAARVSCCTTPCSAEVSPIPRSSGPTDTPRLPRRL